MNTDDILERIENENLTQEDIAYLVDKLCRLTIKSGLEVTPKVQVFLKSRKQVGDTSREETASYLNMSSRTLSRKLKKEHTSFCELVNAEKKRRCLYYMSCNITCGQEIVELLGLSDVSHFYKVFRLWTGYGFSEAKAMLAENNRNIDTIFHRHEDKSDG